MTRLMINMIKNIMINMLSGYQYYFRFIWFLVQNRCNISTEVRALWRAVTSTSYTPADMSRNSLGGHYYITSSTCYVSEFTECIVLQGNCGQHSVVVRLMINLCVETVLCHQKCGFNSVICDKYGNTRTYTRIHIHPHTFTHTQTHIHILAHTHADTQTYSQNTQPHKHTGRDRQT